MPISAPRRSKPRSPTLGSRRVNEADSGFDAFHCSASRRLRLVIGASDMDVDAMNVRLHHGGPQGAKPKGEVVADILAKIRELRV